MFDDATVDSFNERRSGMPLMAIIDPLVFFVRLLLFSCKLGCFTHSGEEQADLRIQVDPYVLVAINRSSCIGQVNQVSACIGVCQISISEVYLVIDRCSIELDRLESGGERYPE
jgi:hypothetical protein